MLNEVLYVEALPQGPTPCALLYFIFAEKVPLSYTLYLTIIPRARMGSESIAHEAHEAEGRMVYWLRGHEGERNNWFSKIQPVGKKYRDKTTLASNTFFAAKKTALFATSGL